MPQAQINADSMRELLMTTAEDMVRARGGMNFSLADVANACGISQANFFRYFETQDSFFEAMAGRWFAELDVIMQDVLESDLSARDKLYEFFARRLLVKRARYEADPALFEAYMALGDEHWEVIRGYVDLADHYMATILGEAIGEGYFTGMEIDHLVSLVNLMAQPFVDPTKIVEMMRTATPDNLRIVVDTIFDGLQARQSGENEPRLKAIR